VREKGEEQVISLRGAKPSPWRITPKAGSFQSGASRTTPISEGGGGSRKKPKVLSHIVSPWKNDKGGKGGYGGKKGPNFKKVLSVYRKGLIQKEQGTHIRRC